MNASESIAPAPAATVVLVRPGARGLEVLLTHRPPTMAFAPGMHVFPGGRVDAADLHRGLAARSAIPASEAAIRLGGDLAPDAALGAFTAAIREAFEEVGVLLAEHASGADLPAARRRLLAEPSSFPWIADALDLRLRSDRLVPLSRWVTPPGLSRRFDARFFAAAIPDGIEATLVGDEVQAHAWHRPVDALESMANGTLDMWLPTSTTLMQLQHARSIEEIGERLAPGRLGTVVVEDVAADVVRIQMPAGGGVAGQPINAYLIGRTRFVLLDPGDPTGSGLDRALEEAARRGGRVVAIAATHVDADHVAGAESIRDQFDIPVYVGPGGGRYLPYPTVEVDDGALIDAGDVPLAVVATPGPRDDHVAFLVGAGGVAASSGVVGSGGFVISGDLDGTRGVRSILGPADDAAWKRSVARLRSVAPDATWLAGHPAVDLPA